MPKIKNILVLIAAVCFVTFSIESFAKTTQINIEKTPGNGPSNNTISNSESKNSEKDKFENKKSSAESDDSGNSPSNNTNSNSESKNSEKDKSENKKSSAESDDSGNERGQPEPITWQMLNDPNIQSAAPSALIPEPGTFALIFLGSLGFILSRKR